MREPRLPGPDHPISIEQNVGHRVMRVAGRVVADTQNALTLKQSNYPPVFYLPRGDVDMSLLQLSEPTSYCPYKGDCTLSQRENRWPPRLLSQSRGPMKLDSHPVGQHFLQIPGPSPVPDRILRAMSLPTIDHRGPEFGALGLKVLSGLKQIFQTTSPVVVYPASGTGAWEAALCNTLSPGDRVLMYETGHFASMWTQMAKRLGLNVELAASEGPDEYFPQAHSWRRAIDVDLIEARLRADAQKRIRAVCVVHNETSTGVTSPILPVRAVLDSLSHPALLLVDSISGLACADYRHDEWGVDVTISGSQKGLMMPPGMSFNALSDRAIEASKNARLPRSYFAWDEILELNKTGYWPYTPNTNLLYGLSEALDMLKSEGLDQVFARHLRWGEAVRAPSTPGDCRFNAPIRRRTPGGDRRDHAARPQRGCAAKVDP